MSSFLKDKTVRDITLTYSILVNEHFMSSYIGVGRG